MQFYNLLHLEQYVKVVIEVTWGEKSSNDVSPTCPRGRQTVQLLVNHRVAEHIGRPKASQSSSHEGWWSQVSDEIIWMKGQSTMVEVVEATYLLRHKWNAEISMEREVWDIPWRSRSQDFGLQPLYDLSMGRLSAAPELNAICPYWFENAFI
jgi:hypothetical protein